MPNTKEKLIELQKAAIRKFMSTETDIPLTDFVADHMIANSVTFATDNNVGSKWIPVTERLPEVASKHKDRWGWHTDSVRVLCVCVQKDGKTMVKEGYLRDWGDECTRWMIPGTIDSVTHWMPLPPAPKGE